jgi:mRNA interferase MazF
MQRGDVCWVLLDPPDKRRPAVILTRDSAIGYLAALTVAPITTTIRQLITQVPLGPGDGLPDDCAANLDSIQTVRKAHIGPRIATLGESKLAQIDRALLFALGMERYGR